MTRVLLIGANAALAQACILLLGQEYELVTAGRSGCDITWDVTKTLTLPKGIDVAVNFAAAFGGQRDDEMLAAERTNGLGSLHICMAARQADVRHIVSISSLSAVHGEDSPYYTIYAVSKRHGDELAAWYCRQHNLPLTILRPSQIFGDDKSFAKHQPFFWNAVEKAAKGDDIVIYGTHDALRNYIHAVDLAELLRRVIDRRILGVFSCQYPTDTTFSQVAEAAQRTFHKGGAITFLKGQPDISDNIFSKEDALYKETGYRPAISVEAGMQRIKKLREGPHP